MKVSSFLGLLLVGLIILTGPDCTRAFAGGKEKLRWLKFDEGTVEAQRSGKKILIDVYTGWCVWCKRMDANTYSDDSVATYLGRRYVLVKLDAESRSLLTYKGQRYSELDLARLFGVNGYPMTVFLKSNGDPITSFPGYADANQFGNVLRFIGEDYYLTKKFDEYLKSRGTE